MKIYYEFVKIYVKMNKIRHDILFIRTCKRDGLLPLFARVRLANPYLRYTKVHFECSQRIFKKEIVSEEYVSSDDIKIFLMSLRVTFISLRLSQNFYLNEMEASKSNVLLPLIAIRKQITFISLISLLH